MTLSLIQIGILLIESIGFFTIERKILIYYTLLVLITVMMFFFTNQ
jgi:hypothetical protein